MRSGMLVLTAAFALWLSMEQTAQACSCLQPDMQRSYENADHVVRVRILAPFGVARGQQRYLGVTAQRAFKGCLPNQTWVVIQTAADDAACGVTLQAGTDYLLHGQDGGRVFGVRVLQVGLCDANSPWSALDPANLAFLNSRSTCCGGKCGCVNDNQVECLVDPCQFSNCDVKGATCNANYCGGCNAEWTDGSGARVCLPTSTQCDDPDRSYVAKSPQQCATLRFQCAAGEAAFFDDCGCGCQTQHPSVTPPCRVGGCSGQLCLGPNDGSGITTCLWRPEYACYRSASCEPQAQGACGWTASDALQTCLDTAR